METAGNAASSIEPFFKFNRHREEVDIRPDITTHRRGGQEDSIAITDRHGTAGLGGEDARFNCERAATHFGGKQLRTIKHLHKILLSNIDLTVDLLDRRID